MLSDDNVGKLAKMTGLLDGSSFETSAGLIDIPLLSVVVAPLDLLAHCPTSRIWQRHLGTMADVRKAQKAQRAAALTESVLLKRGLF
ncbi:hypothetical protein M440DRAFT_1079452 [Trichoderma longibrachiatum ATCC 18648]|uniref:Uncharacterized protein n=1 Tax=Trichoderma longibrachiatum ATCC 18648 TaxID=983965 RepID=A0A2T4BTM2_TRILO|nr:hypothetical protein M440DRAFT_1079452 [Trichoderma longibrachiatum ATCC 18648]